MDGLAVYWEGRGRRSMVVGGSERFGSGCVTFYKPTKGSKQLCPVGGGSLGFRGRARPERCLWK